MTPSQEHEQTLRKLSAANKLCSGANYIVDCETGLVSCAQVWAMGGIAGIEHFDRTHPYWWREYQHAASPSRAKATLWRPTLRRLPNVGPTRWMPLSDADAAAEPKRSE